MNFLPSALPISELRTCQRAYSCDASLAFFSFSPSCFFLSLSSSNAFLSTPRSCLILFIRSVCSSILVFRKSRVSSADSSGFVPSCFFILSETFSNWLFLPLTLSSVSLTDFSIADTCWSEYLFSSLSLSMLIPRFWSRKASITVFLSVSVFSFCSFRVAVVLALVAILIILFSKPSVPLISPILTPFSWGSEAVACSWLPFTSFRDCSSVPIS